MNNETLGSQPVGPVQLLERAQELFGLTQLQLAEILGVSSALISQWKKGVTPLSELREKQLLELLDSPGSTLDSRWANVFSSAKTIALSIVFSHRENMLEKRGGQYVADLQLPAELGETGKISPMRAFGPLAKRLQAGVLSAIDPREMSAISEEDLDRMGKRNVAALIHSGHAQWREGAGNGLKVWSNVLAKEPVLALLASSMVGWIHAHQWLSVKFPSLMQDKSYAPGRALLEALPLLHVGEICQDYNLPPQLQASLLRLVEKNRESSKAILEQIKHDIFSNHIDVDCDIFGLIDLPLNELVLQGLGKPALGKDVHKEQMHPPSMEELRRLIAEQNELLRRYLEREEERRREHEEWLRAALEEIARRGMTITNFPAPNPEQDNEPKIRWPDHEDDELESRPRGPRMRG